MTDHSDYTAVANALLIDLHNMIAVGIPDTGFNGVPTLFAGMVPAALVPAAAGQFAKTAVDALDRHRATVAIQKAAADAHIMEIAAKAQGGVKP